MAAKDSLNQELFHGTPVELQEGDIITANRRRQYLPEHLLRAYATDNPNHAGYFGKNVYEVSPVDPEDVSGPHEMARYDNEPIMNEFTSRSGFVVRRKL